MVIPTCGFKHRDELLRQHQASSSPRIEGNRNLLAGEGRSFNEKALLLGRQVLFRSRSLERGKCLFSASDGLVEARVFLQISAGTFEPGAAWSQRPGA
jgi:hypothetical protein